MLADRRITNRASAAGAAQAGAPCARSLYATGQAHKRNRSLLGRARQLQALVRRRATHAFPFLRNSTSRAFTSRLTRAAGTGLLSGSRIVPFDVSYPVRSIAWARANAALIG